MAAATPTGLTFDPAAAVVGAPDQGGAEVLAELVASSRSAYRLIIATGVSCWGAVVGEHDRRPTSATIPAAQLSAWATGPRGAGAGSAGATPVRRPVGLVEGAAGSDGALGVTDGARRPARRDRPVAGFSVSKVRPPSAATSSPSISRRSSRSPSGVPSVRSFVRCGRFGRVVLRCAGGRSGAATASKTTALPMPPPAHMAATPVPPPRRSSWTMVMIMRAPVMAIGWPRLQPLPSTLTMPSSSPGGPCRWPRAPRRRPR